MVSYYRDPDDRPTKAQLDLEEAIANGWTPCPELETGHDWRKNERYPWAEAQCAACGRSEGDGPDDYCEVWASAEDDRGREYDWQVTEGSRADCEAWIEYRRGDYPYERVGYRIETITRQET